MQSLNSSRCFSIAALLTGLHVASGAAAQEIAVSLTHDAPGPVAPLTPVEFTFSFAWDSTDYLAAESVVARIPKSGPPLYLSTFLFHETPAINGGGEVITDPGGGFSRLRFTNSLFLDAFGPAATLDNPFHFATFRALPICQGTITYDILPELGTDPETFAALGISPFQSESFPYSAVNVNTQPLEVTADAPVGSMSIAPTPGVLGADGAINARATAPNGDLIVAGAFTTIEGVPAPGLARFDGEAWTPINQSSLTTIDQLDIAPNGDLIAAREIFANRLYYAVFRLDADTGAPLDSLVLTGRGVGVKALTDGSVLIHGRNLASSDLRFDSNSIVRWNGPTLDNLGLTIARYVYDTEILPTGELVLATDLLEPGAGSAPSVLIHDGTTWQPLGTPPPHPVNGIQLAADGSIIVNALSPNIEQRNIWRFRNNQWAMIDPAPFDGLEKLTTLPDGGLLARGAITAGQFPEFYTRILVRLDADDNPTHIGFGDAAQISPSGFPFPQPDGSIDYLASAPTTLRFTNTSPCCLPIDFNADALIDSGDINALIASFLAGDLAADLNGDGILDQGDLSTFVQTFLNCVN